MSGYRLGPSCVLGLLFVGSFCQMSCLAGLWNPMQFGASAQPGALPFRPSAGSAVPGRWGQLGSTYAPTHNIPSQATQAVVRGDVRKVLYPFENTVVTLF